MKSIKLRTRLTLLIVIATIPIFATIIFFISTEAAKLLKEDALENLRATNDSLDASVSQWLDAHEVLLRQLTNLPDIVAMDAELQMPILQATAFADSDLFLVQTVNLNGINVARNDNAAPKDYSDREWFLGAWAGNPVTTEALISRTTGNPALNMSMPIKDAGGTIIGVMSIVSELDEVTAAVQASKIGDTGYAYVVDGLGHVIAHPAPAFSRELHDLSGYPPVVSLQDGVQGSIDFTDEEGVEWTAYVDQLDNGWGVIVQQQKSELLNPLRYFQLISWTISLIGILVLLAGARFVIRRAIDPVERLTKTALAIADGDLDRTTPVVNEDEIGMLASAFNRMTTRMHDLILSLEQRIKQQNQMQVELNSSLLRQTAILDNIPDLAWLKDEEGRFIAVNESFCQACGLAPADMVGKTDLDIWTEELAQKYRRDDLEVMHTEKRKHLEERLIDSQGQEKWIETIKTPIFDANGKLMGTAGIARDVTERKQAEALTNLRIRLFEFAGNHSLEELLQKTLDEVSGLTNSPIGFYHFVEDDQKTLSLQAWSTRTLKEFCHAEAKNAHYYLDQAGVWADCVRERRIVIHNDYASLVNRKGLPEGHATVIRELVVPIQRGNRIVAVLGVGNKSQEYTDKDAEIVSYLADVTWELAERKYAEAEREKLITELEAKNAELERFTYTVSHDLKSPLVTISGFLGYLEQDAASGNTERLKKDALRIQEAVKKMQRLLYELLELSRIGRMMNAPVKIPFNELVREGLEIVHGRLEERGVTVQVHPNLPPVYGDRPRLVEVLQNLLDNAVKYMGDQPDPFIEIGQRGEENGLPVFFVKDNGMGIAPEHYERIFGLFNKLDSRSEGTGVGLALVKRIIEFHGGRIWVESEAGKGSTFLFTLLTGPDA